MSSLQDVADFAKVSLTTASQALNGKKVNEQTRQRVLDAAKKLHYYVNVNGRNLITRRTNSICMTIICSDRENDMVERLSDHYPMMIGAMKYLQTAGCSMRLETILWEEIADSDYFEQKVFGRADDGMIIFPQFKYRCDFVKLFDDEGFPYVFVNPGVELKGRNVVMPDEYAGGRMAAAYIAGQRHRRILFINGAEEQISSENIERGFTDELLARGIRFDRGNIIYSDGTHEGGYYAMKRVLSDSTLHPTCTFCANDYMATGAMTALHENGLNIPRDMSLMGFGGSEASKYVFPRLSTIDMDVSEIGMEAASRLLKLVNGEGDGLEAVRIMPRLAKRSTVMKL